MDATERLVEARVAAIMGEASDDHFYGAWKGGPAASGGRPMTKKEAAKPNKGEKGTRHPVPDRPPTESEPFGDARGERAIGQSAEKVAPRTSREIQDAEARRSSQKAIRDAEARMAKEAYDRQAPQREFIRQSNERMMAHPGKVGSPEHLAATKAAIDKDIAARRAAAKPATTPAPTRPAAKVPAAKAPTKHTGGASPTAPKGWTNEAQMEKLASPDRVRTLSGNFVTPMVISGSPAQSLGAGRLVYEKQRDGWHITGYADRGMSDRFAGIPRETQTAYTGKPAVGSGRLPVSKEVAARLDAIVAARGGVKYEVLKNGVVQGFSDTPGGPVKWGRYSINEVAMTPDEIRERIEMLGGAQVPADHPLRQALAEAEDEGHFYGAWHGGPKSAGGGPGRLPTKAARVKDLASKIGAKNVGKPGEKPGEKQTPVKAGDSKELKDSPYQMDQAARAADAAKQKSAMEILNQGRNPAHDRIMAAQKGDPEAGRADYERGMRKAGFIKKGETGLIMGAHGVEVGQTVRAAKGYGMDGNQTNIPAGMTGRVVSKSGDQATIKWADGRTSTRRITPDDGLMPQASAKALPGGRVSNATVAASTKQGMTTGTRGSDMAAHLADQNHGRVPPLKTLQIQHGGAVGSALHAAATGGTPNAEALRKSLQSEYGKIPSLAQLQLAHGEKEGAFLHAVATGSSAKTTGERLAVSSPRKAVLAGEMSPEAYRTAVAGRSAAARRGVEDSAARRKALGR